MISNKIINKFLKSDTNRPIPLDIRLYMLLFPKAKNNIKKLKKELEVVKHETPFFMERDMSNSIMEQIIRIEVDYVNYMSYSKWIMAGLIIFASVFLISYSNSFIWMKSYFGTSLELPLNIITGVIITLYSILFVGVHLEDVKKLEDFIVKKIHGLLS
jgi:membrane glycosyltransferase